MYILNSILFIISITKTLFLLPTWQLAAQLALPWIQIVVYNFINNEIENKFVNFDKSECVNFVVIIGT